jgi:hypothetical protein
VVTFTGSELYKPRWKWGGDGTLICLKDYTFSSPDCTHRHAAFIGVDSKDFDAILSVALAAKMSGKQVKIFYSGFSNNYPRIKEITID